MNWASWPWPRNLLARLVQTLNRDGPAAIGLNMLMSESDALSPERLLAPEQIEATAAWSMRCAPCPRTTRNWPARWPWRRPC